MSPRPAFSAVSVSSLFSLLILGACSAPRTTPVTAPVPAPATAPVPAAAPTPGAAPTPTATREITEAPKDWQLLDAAADGVPGTSARRAVRELLAGRTPQRTVVVAVVDGGVDTAHVALRSALWSNAKEVAANGKDDDNNGYADDTRGWNFLGGASGENVNWDTLELTREQVRCTKLTAVPSPTAATDSTRARCAAIARQFEAKRTELQQMSAQLTMIDGMYRRSVRILRTALPTDSVTEARVRALAPAVDSVRQARELFLRMTAAGITGQAIADSKEDVQGQLEYGLNTDFDPRKVIGDNPSDPAERRYGNRDVTGPDAKHGTHVAGIIAAARDAASGVEGIGAGAMVRLMPVRAVPNGDEHDKDVANAIRYAVDNGAQIINMSFGKGFSPDKAAVDAAVKYADSKGVLLVHAAGNDGEDLAESPSFPVAGYAGGGSAANWIEVGASSWKGGSALAAPFSNYGKAQVDLFAPGVDILSTVPGGGFARESGTSMASPVVAGVAALLMSYFPKLSAGDVKRLLVETATPHGDEMVVRPGTQGEKVRFGELSRTGGIVNAYAAVKAALAAGGVAQ
ncbi:MAG: S8 family serine peptidase [Gemmatimonadaceae bacterium]|nr:S8 family serine peptidase [Gemmatimonadaceae bacterium]